MKIIKVFCALLILIAVFCLITFWLNFRAPGKIKSPERFVLPIDTIESEIVKKLLNGGYLRNATIFNLILDFKNWHNKIQPGAYLISRNMNAYILAKTLISGPYQKWVIIPPGKRKEQTGLILEKSLEWNRQETLDFIGIVEEGYLFPDTYLIDVEGTPITVYQTLKNNFNVNFDATIQAKLLAKNIRNDTAIKLASIIEREAGGGDEPMIAGILWNRLLQDIRLEVDATVQYAIANQQCDLGTQAPKLDNCVYWQAIPQDTVRKIKSDYNTYLVDGLPPGPICSPGIEAIMAVAEMAETDALFYLHSSDKVIHTAKTYRQHLENIKGYLR